MGLLIESPDIAAAVSGAVDQVMGEGAYALRLSPAGNLEWITRLSDGTRVITDIEPNTTWVDRLLVTIVGVLPIEWMM
jgi:putative cardiolipin synthase